MASIFKINRNDGVVLGIFTIATIGFAVAAIRQYAENQLTLKLMAVGRYNANPTEVIGQKFHYRGLKNCPYTLIEFGDYQCGPCRAENPKVESLIRTHQSQLGFVFRNLPLTKIHPLAMQAAVVAEESKSPSEFWSIHDLLYAQGSLNTDRILQAQQTLANAPSLEQTAHSIIENDITEAKALGIQSTPTFVLCCPKGMVRRITSLDQVAEILKN